MKGVCKMRDYKMHFRYRDDNDKLHDDFQRIRTTSARKAKDYGKKIEAEREKYWFVGLD